MRFEDLPLAAAEGALLAHGQRLGDTRWSKGRLLTAGDLAAAAAAGLNRLTVARLDPDDVGEDDAAATLARALAGHGIEALPAAHGRANLAATADGLIELHPAAIDTINSLDESLTIGTLAPLARVSQGEIVATIKVIRYAVDSATLAAAVAAAHPLRLHPFRPQPVALLATRLPGLADKAMAKTARVTRARITALGCPFTNAGAVPHDTAALAAALAARPEAIILIVGASASVDRADVIPAAIVAAGGEIIRLGMPVDPGNMLVLGHLDGRPVIGLPGCARSPRRNGFDIVLERLVAGLAVTSADIARMGTGGLLPEAERPQPRA
ncbi:molybdopterin-binding protein [Polymorphobacter sp.]|uniref:molybdopterin-binding protein n=1 Tax=Polymorphobacter sp. TaxID=1909290 RepID=UPI003F713645